ncbi:uncharacterized protein K489DRAFT_377425 [Dissoconium aciculare CBS 342.82]|jgi:hypothetical protein|uniref:Uncharacterized protein n=1 Tax=Dissoconium aciculare CBS 342.82 TaxID=1314786 RepID=A0A6J3MDG7_9PEZI|nr:uncharacterized protein K489DRAFT_377425 [Dissoconium aciculare CBS 342.82]KAF1824887.1 hypothetical protein K489DRAFT_377425 [Dissoconium aciculare CBS 342.82]
MKAHQSASSLTTHAQSAQVEATAQASGKKRYALSVIVSNIAYPPTDRSHWALGLHEIGQSSGFFLHAVISLHENKYRWTVDGGDLPDIFYGAEGHFKIAEIDPRHVASVKMLMQKMLPPQQEGAQCQDYVIATAYKLEEVGILPKNTFNRLLSLRLQSVNGMRAAAGPRWTNVTWRGPA